ncbi:hypothetical protein [Citreimonas sp.]|uniref:hypothetical protein n=1 Tax=Citreimonas sp. TaxID=3036715 RepID=UPI00405A140E
MDDAQRRFEQRCSTVRRKHLRMASGYVTRLDRSGVILQTPIQRARPAVWRPLALAFVGALGIKVLILSGMGPEAYEAKRAELVTGNGVERAGALLMQVDPLTARVAEWMRPLLP